MTVELPPPGPPLRIAVLGDLEGLHTRRWLSAFVDRGHEVHAISYYAPHADPPGVRVHALTGRKAPSAGPGSGQPARTRSTLQRLPPSLLRFVHAWRYRSAGLKRTLESIAPDVFHAHYAVEHGFYGALAGFHPYVVSAWGSDLFIDSYRLFGRIAVRYALSRADLVTANDPALARRAVELGVPEERVHVIRLGVDQLFLAEPRESVNLRDEDDTPPTVISDRALEPLYNVDIVIRAFAKLLERLPNARLLIAGDGSKQPHLEALSRDLGLGESVCFLGQIAPAAMRSALESAHVYVSVPRSDSLSSSTLEAMACGCFPVVSDLPSHDGMIEHGTNGLRVQPGSIDALAGALYQVLTDASLRRDSVAHNRALVEAEGARAKNMLALERHFYRLAGHPLASSETI